MYVQNQTCLLAELASIIATVAATGPYDGPTAYLFTNSLYPTRTNILTDFVITPFNGVNAGVVVTWGTITLNINTQAEVLGQLIIFLTTSAPTTPVTAYGYVLVNKSATDWLLAESFATPFVFNANNQQLGLIPRLVIAA
jgi:hypothetical protein